MNSDKRERVPNLHENSSSNEEDSKIKSNSPSSRDVCSPRKKIQKIADPNEYIPKNKNSEDFLESQRKIVENLVFPPVDPNILPQVSSKPKKQPLPKTPIPRNDFNNPPENYLADTPEDIVEDRRKRARLEVDTNDPKTESLPSKSLKSDKDSPRSSKTKPFSTPHSNSLKSSSDSSTNPHVEETSVKLTKSSSIHSDTAIIHDSVSTNCKITGSDELKTCSTKVEPGEKDCNPEEIVAAVTQISEELVNAVESTSENIVYAEPSTEEVVDAVPTPSEVICAVPSTSEEIVEAVSTINEAVVDAVPSTSGEVVGAEQCVSEEVVETGPSTSSELMDPAKNLNLNESRNYQELEIIGNGAYGTVYKGRDLTERGRMVAMKKIKISLTDDGVPVSAVREISLLKNLDRFRHPNIVRLLDICHGAMEGEQRLNLVLVFEYVEMDLDIYLKKMNRIGLSHSKIKNLAHQMMNGVDFLHQNRIIHRDLKPQNLLIDKHDRLKIADFGLARVYDYNMRVTTTVVTLWYRAPEILLSYRYSSPVDIWSCACIFAELFRKRPLFEGRTEGEQLQRIIDVIGTPSETEWPPNVGLSFSQFQGKCPKAILDVVPQIPEEAADLLQSMLTFSPDKRSTACQSLKHPYFKTSEPVDSEKTLANFALLAKSVDTDRYLPLSSGPEKTNLSMLASVSSAVSEDNSKGKPELTPESTTSSTPEETNPNSSTPETLASPNDENNPNSSNIGSVPSASTAATKHTPGGTSSNGVSTASPANAPSSVVSNTSSGRHSSTESEL